MIESVVSTMGEPTSPYSGKSNLERSTGRFYTPDVLAADLAKQVVSILLNRSFSVLARPQIRACDPFCGDGRLIIALLEVAAKHDALLGKAWAITLRDIERSTVAGAQKNVQEAARRLGIDVKIKAVPGDSFATSSPKQHDAVITNPPWELLKPDVRELAHLSMAEALLHRAQLRRTSDLLDAKFPEAKADRAWGGWSTNLARCGWELAIRSCASGGAIGIVLPATILGDQASASMRKSALSRTTLLDIVSYPPEAKLFLKVDQPVVAATFFCMPSEGGLSADVRLFDLERSPKKTKRLRLSEAELSARDYSLPVVFGVLPPSLRSKFTDFPRFSDLEGRDGQSLWSGRELDETRIAEKLVRGVRHPFVKGKMIRRHGIAEPPRLSVRADLAAKFKSAEMERIVWRDVSRASQARRMTTAIIPAGWIAGNSLHVAYFRDGNRARLLALYAVLSSYIFEFQVRCHLTTGHMSLGVIRSTRMPPLEDKTLSKLASLAEGVLAGNSSIKLEIAVAHAYHVNRDEMAEILSYFSGVPSVEKEALLKSSLWLRPKFK
jgi:Alw26I/Eco31I/Esp3I family type II restriction m6 adenine DNA methyltransferase